MEPPIGHRPDFGHDCLTGNSHSRNRSALKTWPVDKARFSKEPRQAPGEIPSRRAERRPVPAPNGGGRAISPIRGQETLANQSR